MNIWAVVLHTAESLYVLTHGLAILPGDDMQVTCLARSLVASGKGANKLVAQIRPGRDGIYRQVHQPRHDVGLKHQWKVVGEHLVIASSSSLHHDSVDAEELRWVSLAVVLFSDLRLEGAVGGPLELP